MAEKKGRKTAKIGKPPTLSEKITETEKGSFSGKPVWGKFVNGRTVPTKKK